MAPSLTGRPEFCPKHCFSDLVDLSYAELGGTGKVVFENVIFEKAADFLRTRFWNDAIFVRNRFSRFVGSHKCDIPK